MVEIGFVNAREGAAKGAIFKAMVSGK